MKMRRPILTVLFATLCLLSACTNATPTYHQGVATMANSYDQAHANSSAQFDEQERALIVGHTKRMDIELKADLKALAMQVKLDPVKWSNPADVAGETVRLQTLHDTKITDYKASLADFRGLKTKNEEVNLKTAHAIRDVLNPPPALPKPAAAPTVDLTKQIQAAGGGAKAPASIIPE